MVHNPMRFLIATQKKQRTPGEGGIKAQECDALRFKMACYGNE